MNLLDAYPFALGAFPSDAEATMDRELARLGERFGLFGDDAPYRTIVKAYIRHCSRPVPPGEAIELLTHLVYLIYYYDDFSRSSDYSARVEGFLDIVQGKEVDGDDIVLRCVRDFMQRLRRASVTNPAKLSAFQHACEQCWSAYLWESHGVPVQGLDSDTYRAMRRDRVATRPFLELHKMTNGHSIALERYFGPLTRVLDWLAIEIVYLVNDLYSVERDRRNGQENLITIVAREQACSLDEAVARVREEHDMRLRELVQRGQELVESVGAAGLARVSLEETERYLELLRGCVRGNIAAVLDLRARYHLPGSPAPQAGGAQAGGAQARGADEPATER